MSPELLSVSNIRKEFPGVVALKNITFSLHKGEVHSLCGENGAGKSTLIKVLSGVYTPTKGSIYVERKEVQVPSPQIAKHLGIATIYQENSLFQGRSILENIFVGQEFTMRGVLYDERSMWEKATEVLQLLNFTKSPHTLVKNLGGAEQKVIEIARALIQETKVLILDEPTANLGRDEVKLLYRVIQRVQKEGVGIIYISHHLEEVFELSTRITVIRDGEVIQSYDASVVSEGQVICDMVGREASSFYQRERATIQGTSFRVRELCGNGVKNISFDLKKGEILGVAGIAGAGRTELMEVLFGVKSMESGAMWMDEHPVFIQSPKDAIRHGMCLLTEERKLTGIFASKDIIDNTSVAHITNSKQFLFRPKKEKENAKYYVKKLKTKTKSVHTPIKNLSGGNQQKVILSKWFYTDPNIFIFDEPTRGIDIGAKEEIYALMVELAKQGKSIIMVSSDMPELVAMSDRVLVMKKGEVAGELEGDRINESNVIELAL